MANEYDVHLEDPNHPGDGPHWFVAGDCPVKTDQSVDDKLVSELQVGWKVRRNPHVPFQTVLSVTDLGA